MTVAKWKQKWTKLSFCIYYYKYSMKNISVKLYDNLNLWCQRHPALSASKMILFADVALLLCTKPVAMLTKHGNFEKWNLHFFIYDKIILIVKISVPKH